MSNSTYIEEDEIIQREYEEYWKRIKNQKNESVGKDLENAANEYAAERFRTTRSEDVAEKCKWSFITGAKWNKKHLWKDAQGDDLPEIDREVIALQGRKVVFAHRPPEYWDGKNIDTGEVTRHYPQTYDKGGWNIKGVTYWLDAPLPKGIE